MKRLSLCVLLLAKSIFCLAQMQDYQYRRPLTGISSQWHRIQIPEDAFGKMNKAFSDIRIYGLNGSNDTIEAPYILKIKKEQATQAAVPVEVINQVKTGNTYFYTFEIPAGKKINELEMDFSLRNFDWKVKLEGSADGKNWFTVLENYRIVAVNIDIAKDYKFTTIRFPTVQYSYLRVSFKSNESPGLTGAKIQENEIASGSYNTYKINSQQRREDKAANTSILNIALEKPVPVSSIALAVTDSFDFYRQIHIEYVSDSFKNAAGKIVPVWSVLYDGVLSSLEPTIFHTPEVLTGRLAIYIHNHNNEPLNTGAVTVKGAVYVMYARFTKSADYFLVYGNESAVAPVYDIANFTHRIPSGLTALLVGPEEKNISTKPQIKKAGPLFENKLWLWAIMVVVIALLGWFTLNMLRSR